MFQFIGMVFITVIVLLLIIFCWRFILKVVVISFVVMVLITSGCLSMITDVPFPVTKSTKP